MVSRHRIPTRWEIWWVDVNPSRGSEQAGKRPALIVSDTGFNRLQHRILVVVPMTTTVRDYAFHVAAEPEHTGLRKPGMIMCDQLLTIAAERLLDAEPAGPVPRRYRRAHPCLAARRWARPMPGARGSGHGTVGRLGHRHPQPDPDRSNVRSPAHPSAAASSVSALSVGTATHTAQETPASAKW
jgi:mRNA interferase MazF